MKLGIVRLSTTFCFLGTASDAFSTRSLVQISGSRNGIDLQSSSTLSSHSYTKPTHSTLFMNTHSPQEQMVADDEIARLKSMAQKLRAEASALEAERAQELANAATVAFDKFDKNNDGEISFDELKIGLEQTLKTELSDERVKMIMDEFDLSGDGKLQIEEMVTVEQFRNKLELIAQEEKRLAKEMSIQAKKEEDAAMLAEAKLDLLNEKEPTTRDKVLSVLPYLFPLMDSLQFGRFLLVENPDNPAVGFLALLNTAYRSIPFSGFVAFFALNFLSSKPGINRLVRFSMQQAIYLDIALFFPGLATAIIGAALSAADVNLPASFVEVSNNVIFISMLVTVAYASISSLLGIAPNKIPFISQAVEDRMPTVDMFDDEGRYIPRQMRDDRKKESDDDKE